MYLDKETLEGYKKKKKYKKNGQFVVTARWWDPGEWRTGLGANILLYTFLYFYLWIVWMCFLFYKYILELPFMIQWLGIHLPKKGTQMWSLVREDSKYYGEATPVCCNYWSIWAPGLSLHKRSDCNEKPAHHNYRVVPLPATRGSQHRRFSTAKNG